MYGMHLKNQICMSNGIFASPQLHTCQKKKENHKSFTYSRKVGPFINVEGWGKSVGTFHKEDGSRTSSLHFGTDQWISPIREGRGYWKYEPQEDGVKFLTQYDYDVNFGRVGKIADKFIFRPLIGWATALSFDVLKRWLEKGEAPRSQYIRFFSTYMMTVSIRIHMDLSRVNSKNHWNASRRTCDGWKYFFVYR